MTLIQQVNENNIKESEIDLKITDFENALNVYQDKDLNWFYNLNQTTEVAVDQSLLKTYTCTIDSHWPLISYNIYSTTRLAWLLMQLNNVKAVDVFKCIQAGEQVYYIGNEQLHTVITNIQDYSS